MQTLFAQSTFTSVAGDVSWRNNASWTGTATFPAHADISNNNYVIAANSIVRLGSTTDTRNLTAANSSGGRTFTINGTLIVYGDVDFSNQAADIIMGNNSLLIVFGDITMGNMMDISSTGNIIATGSFTKAGSENQGSYTGGGNVYASPIDVPGTWIPTADQKNNTTDLQNDLPNVFNFINCGGGPGCTLPISLDSFTGSKAEDESIVLQWSTIMEENFSGFVLERSGNGISYHNLKEIASSGRNKYNIKTSYSFTDQSPLVGNNYYRLKALDFDGKVEFFGPIMVKWTGDPQLSIYPNPVNGSDVRVLINFHPGDQARVSLISPLGVEVLNTHITDLETVITLTENIGSGVYYLRYISNEFTQTVRLLVK